MNRIKRNVVVAVMMAMAMGTEVAAQGFAGGQKVVKQMKDAGVEVKFNSYPGDHEWQVWRKSLHEFAQYLFK